MVVDLWSNSVHWWGWNFTIHTRLLTPHDAGISLSPPPNLPATHIVVSWNREDVEWAKYKSNNLSGVWCDHCDWHGIEARVSMLFAHDVGQHGGFLSCSWPAVYAGPFTRHQKTLLEIIIAVMHCFERKRVGLCAFVTSCNCCCEFDLCQWATLWTVRRAMVHHIVQPHVIAWLRNVTSIGVPSPLLGLISYLFQFRNTRLSTYWGSRREQR